MFHRDLLNSKPTNGVHKFPKFAFKCKICGHQFQWKSSLWRHKKEKHSTFTGQINDVIADESRPEMSGNEDSMDADEAIPTADEEDKVTPKAIYSEPLKPFSCDYCDTRFSTHKARRKHVRCKHPEVDKAELDRCTSPSNGILLDLSAKEYDQMLLQSDKVTTPPGVYPCPDCGIEFRIKSSMMSHRARKHSRVSAAVVQEASPPKGFQCGICGASFALMLSLKVHITKKHGPKARDSLASGLPIASHNYETKSARRAKLELQSVKSEELHDADTFIVQQDSLETQQMLDSDIDSKESESGASSTSAKPASKVWVNPRIADYERISDIKTLTCNICDTNFEDRKRLFIHLNKCHLNGKSIDELAEEMIFNSENQSQVDQDEMEVGENGVEGGSSAGKSSCRKVRNYSKICDFETLTCKLCPRQCSSLSQLQNHALYKHMDQVELVPMKGVTTSICSESVSASTHGAHYLDLQQAHLQGAAVVESAPFGLQGTGGDGHEVDTQCVVSAANGCKRLLDDVTEPNSDENQNNGGHKMTSNGHFLATMHPLAVGKKNSIYLYEDYVILKSHTCLLCDKDFSTTSNLLRHMTAVHKNKASCGGASMSDENSEIMQLS